MGIGASVFMLAVGAIITFAFNIRVGWLDLDIVGWVLMAAGALGLILTLTVFSGRRHDRDRTASGASPASQLRSVSSRSVRPTTRTVPCRLTRQHLEAAGAPPAPAASRSVDLRNRPLRQLDIHRTA